MRRSAGTERAFIVATLTDDGERFARQHIPDSGTCGGLVVADIVVKAGSTSGNEVLKCTNCRGKVDVWYIVDRLRNARVGFGTKSDGGCLVLTPAEALAALDLQRSRRDVLSRKLVRLRSRASRLRDRGRSISPELAKHLEVCGRDLRAAIKSIEILRGHFRAGEVSRVRAR